ncbi:MAG TPA: Lrp/AsnC family transcriptional regulator [candidate division Zixibacteria bacterium]|nr:Lrp/AsnC family transcriptional regulator [candidate division Zixibacteria bacterium]
MKNVELRLISELMKNSRRSDRQLAKALGVSQPTVSRLVSRLEKEGKIREYTMIPDFKQIGYNIMAVVFLGKQESMKEEERLALRKAAIEMEKEPSHAAIVVVNGIGLNKGRMIILFCKDYSDYYEQLTEIKNLPHIDSGDVDSFIIDLNDYRNFRNLSMIEVARAIEASGKTSREKLQSFTQEN